MEHKEPYHTESLETCIRHRHSIRFYTSEPVDETILRECLALAQLAPSNSNIQNWRLHVAMGAARERVVAALHQAAADHGPNIPPLPEHFKHYRSEFGHLLYGDEGYGIKRSDKEGHKAATLRNYDFFGAPAVAVLAMDNQLSPVDAMSVGMFTQTLMLALTERGLGTCLEVSVTGYPDVLRKEFRIPEDQTILCGLAIGHPAVDNKVNNIVVSRDDLNEQVTFHRD